MTNLSDTFYYILPAYTQGLVLSLGLIVAIGAQNAFVLRQGLRREYVASIVIFCALADAILIAAGVFGMAKALGERPMITKALSLAGAVFLATYGWQALRRAQQSNQLRPAESGVQGKLAAVILQAAGFTLLNPHVYLDTVLLLGSIGAQQAPALRPWFVIGASCASVLWFSMLGFGARWLAPWFARPKAWQILDGLIGVTMWLLAFLLLQHTFFA